MAVAPTTDQMYQRREPPMHGNGNGMRDNSPRNFQEYPANQMQKPAMKYNTEQVNFNQTNNQTTQKNLDLGYDNITYQNAPTLNQYRHFPNHQMQVPLMVYQ
jgi:hypothetical protein